MVKHFIQGLHQVVNCLTAMRGHNRRAAFRPAYEALEDRFLLSSDLSWFQLPDFRAGPLPVGDDVPAGISVPRGFTDLTLGPDSNFWFLQDDVKAIGRITPEGAYAEFPYPTGTSLQGLTTGSDGNLWASAPNRVYQITVGGRLSSYAAPGGTRLRVSTEQGVWLDSSDSLWTIESEGQLSRTILPGFSENESVTPQFLTSDHAGNVWFVGAGTRFSRSGPTDGWQAEPGLMQIGMLSLDGKVRQFELESAEESSIADLVWGSDGHPWLLRHTGSEDQNGSSEIGRIDPITGEATWFSTPNWYKGIVPAPDGNLWLTGRRLGRLSPEGVLTDYRLEFVAGSPETTVVGVDGDLWYLSGKNQVIVDGEQAQVVSRLGIHVLAHLDIDQLPPGEGVQLVGVKTPVLQSRTTEVAFTPYDETALLEYQKSAYVSSFRLPDLPTPLQLDVSSFTLDPGTSPVLIETNETRMFLQAVYQELLGRRLDAVGEGHWSFRLRQGDSRVLVVQAIANSEEYRSRLVQNLYATYLHREGETAGVQFFVSLLGHEGTIDSIRGLILGSQEYLETQGNGDDTAFLESLYRDILGREADESGLTFWQSRMNQGVSREQLAGLILGSTEARGRMLGESYRAYLQREADTAGLAYFLNVWQAGWREEDILANLLGSEEYWSLQHG